METMKKVQKAAEVEKRTEEWKTKYAGMTGKIPDQIFLKCASIDYIRGRTNICCYIGLVKSDGDGPKTYTKNYYSGKPVEGDVPKKARNIKMPTNRDGIQFTTAEEYFAYCLSECGYTVTP